MLLPFDRHADPILAVKLSSSAAVNGNSYKSDWSLFGGKSMDKPCLGGGVILRPKGSHAHVRVAQYNCAIPVASVW